MKKIKYIIFLFIIIIISIITILFIIKKNKNKDEYEDLGIVVPEELQEDFSEVDPPQELSNKEYNTIKNVTFIDNYFTIKALTDKYINLIGYNEKKELKNILSPAYIEQYKITDNNIINIENIPKITGAKNFYKIIITDIKECQIDSNMYLYFVKGNGRLTEKNNLFKFNIMLEVDFSKNLYNIYPTKYVKDKNYDKLQIGDKFNYNIEKIKHRENNVFLMLNKTDIDLVNEYLNNYVEMLTYYKEEAYNKLDREYFAKRFGSKENFYRYIEDNKMLISLMSVDKYKTIDNNNIKDYICSDQYKNIFIFREKNGIMKYSVFLDNYTVMRSEDMKQYSEADEETKVSLNLNKLTKKINTKDYNSIYNLLNANFKNSNFKNINEFKKYLQNYLYEINDLQIESIENNNGYYVSKCNVINQRNTEESKYMTVFIKLKEGTNFEMSFNIE